MDAEPLQPALQSAAALQDGGVIFPLHLGAVYSTEHPPEQEPLQLAVAPTSALQEPLQLPVQLPLQATAFVPVPVCPAQVPSHVPLQVPEQLAATVKSAEHEPVQFALQVPLRSGALHSAVMLGAVQSTEALHLALQSS
jgi:hypothetical protein